MLSIQFFTGKFRFFLHVAVLSNLFLLFGNIAKCQDSDSLIAVLNMHPQEDTTKVEILVKISNNYLHSKTDEVIKYARQGLEIAQKLDFEKGVFECLEILGNGYLQKNEFPVAGEYFNKAYVIARKSGKKSAIATALYGLGKMYNRENHYDTALEYYHNSLAITRELGDSLNVAKTILSIGNVYADCGNYPKALDNYLNAQKILEKTNNIDILSNCLAEISTLYYSSGDIKKSLEYNNQSLSVFERTGNREGILNSRLTLGDIYGKTGDYKMALETFSRGYELSDSMGMDYYKEIFLGNLAEANYYLGNIDLSFTQYNKCLVEAKASNDLSNIAMAENGIGRVYIKRGKISEGINHLLVAYQITSSNGMKSPASEIAGDLFEAYKKLKDLDNALKYQKIFYELRDSVFNENNELRIKQLQFDDELTRKENTIKLLEKDKEIEMKLAEHQKYTEILLVSGIFILVILSVLMFYGIQVEKKRRKIILCQKEEIEKQAEQLKKLNVFKDKTFSVISHDLRGPIHTSISALTLMEEGHLSNEEFLSIRTEILKQMNAVNVLMDNLLKWAKSSMHGNITSRPAQVNIFELAHQNAILLNENIRSKQIMLHNEIPVEMMVYCDPDQMDVVIRNLMTNAVKFTKPKGQVKLGAVRDGGQVRISITDTGIGMTDHQIQNLFMPVADNSTYGTAGEKGIGLGLLLCYDFINSNGGSISVTSEVNKGTTFTVLLPAADA